MRECKYGEAYFNFRFRVRQRLGDRHSPSEDGRPCGRPMARRKTGILADALWPVGRRASLRTPYGPSEDGRPCGRPMARRKTGILADALWPVGQTGILADALWPVGRRASLRTPYGPSEDGHPCGRPMARRNTGVLADALWRGPSVSALRDYRRVGPTQSPEGPERSDRAPIGLLTAAVRRGCASVARCVNLVGLDPGIRTRREGAASRSLQPNRREATFPPLVGEGGN